MKSPKVRILNPLPGEVQFTSLDRAVALVEQGIAEWRNSPSRMAETGLFFVHSLRGYRRERRDAADYWASQRSCINWAGHTDGAVLHVPGEVRS